MILRDAFRIRLVSCVAAGVVCAVAAPALADFRLCNRTESRVGVSIGYKDQGAWSTEGWWNVASKSCETLLRGSLSARFYYVYAVDYDRGGEWNGKAYMCTRDKEFTINGIEDCAARGYERSGFFEIDTGEQKSWTVQLTEPAKPGLLPQSSTGPVRFDGPSAGIEIVAAPR